MKTVGALCEALVLGQVLVRIQDNKLYNPDYRSFRQFLMDAEKKTKTSRSILFECMSIAAIPRIEPEEVEKMPYTNVNLLARAAKVIEDPKILTEVRKDAAKLGVAAYREKLEAKGLLAKRGRPDGRRRRGPITLHITVPNTLGRIWYELDQPVEAFVEWLKKYSEKELGKAAA